MGNSVHPQWLHNWRLISDNPTITEEENQHLINLVISKETEYLPKNSVQIQGTTNHKRTITSAPIKLIRKTANCVLTIYAEDDNKYKISTVSFEMHKDTYFYFGSIGSSVLTRCNAELKNWAFNGWHANLTDDVITKLVNFINDCSQDTVKFCQLCLNGNIYRSLKHPEGEKVTVNDIVSIKRPHHSYTQSASNSLIGERFIAETENHEHIELVFTRATT